MGYSPCVTESKLALLTAQQDNESERQGIEARKETLFRKLLAEKMAGERLKITILLGSGYQVLL